MHLAWVIFAHCTPLNRSPPTERTQKAWSSSIVSESWDAVLAGALYFQELIQALLVCRILPLKQFERALRGIEFQEVLAQLLGQIFHLLQRVVPLAARGRHLLFPENYVPLGLLELPPGNGKFGLSRLQFLRRECERLVVELRLLIENTRRHGQ
jgi:hypothetical protein